MATSKTAATFSQFICCCGADTICNIYNSKPEDVIEQFINTKVLQKTYNYIINIYADPTWKLDVAFLLFAGPDFQPTSSNGTCYAGVKKLAEYVRANSLGTVLETSHKFNPRHKERKPGNGDLVIYIWEVDEPALKAWWEARQPSPAQAGTTPDNVDGAKKK